MKLKEQGQGAPCRDYRDRPQRPGTEDGGSGDPGGPWEVLMLAYSLMNQGARHYGSFRRRSSGIGTLLMFVVRNLFQQRRLPPRHLRQSGRGRSSSPSILSDDDPLAFLVADGAAETSPTRRIATPATSRAPTSSSSAPATRLTIGTTSPRSSVRRWRRHHRAASPRSGT